MTCSERVLYREVLGCEIDRRLEMRLRGLPVLRLDLAEGPLRLAGIAGISPLIELADWFTRRSKTGA